MKEQLNGIIDQLQPEAETMSDAIFDHPETAHQEHFASKLLTDFLTRQGFQVTLALGSQPTAFKGEYVVGDGSGVKIGLLCEYDALEKIGHACGHQMQGPSICSAAAALQKILPASSNARIIVYGTPAEEGGGGKLILLQEGYLRELDFALMMHGSPMTCVDIKSMALGSFKVEFFGKAAHAALKPEEGRSALDALLLAFNGLEFLREHIADDARIHYTISELPGPANVVPAHALGSFNVRSYNTDYLQKQLIPRFKEVIRGAAIMTGTEYKITEGRSLAAKVPVLSLNEIVMANARAVQAPNLQPPRQKTGSSDFGNVMYELPGSCIRMAFVPEGTSSHSQTFVDYGKSEAAHKAINYAAKVVAGTAWDLVTEPAKLAAVKAEFAATKARMAQGAD